MWPWWAVASSRARLEPLRTASAEAAARFFAEVGPEDLVAAVAATADDHLRALAFAGGRMTSLGAVGDVVEIADGVPVVTEGEEGAVRDATVSCEGHDLLELVTVMDIPTAGS